MKNYPKVSVYMPNYNYYEFIEQAITSVVKQNCNHWELLIIQDGNIDKSDNIVKKYTKILPNQIRV